MEHSIITSGSVGDIRTGAGTSAIDRIIRTVRADQLGICIRRTDPVNGKRDDRADWKRDHNKCTNDFSGCEQSYRPAKTRNTDATAADLAERIADTDGFREWNLTKSAIFDHRRGTGKIKPDQHNFGSYSNPDTKRRRTADESGEWNFKQPAADHFSRDTGGIKHGERDIEQPATDPAERSTAAIESREWHHKQSAADRIGRSTGGQQISSIYSEQSAADPAERNHVDRSAGGRTD